MVEPSTKHDIRYVTTAVIQLPYAGTGALAMAFASFCGRVMGEQVKIKKATGCGCFEEATDGASGRTATVVAN